MSDPSDPDSPPPRTTGGNWRWEPPSPAGLEAMLPGYTIEKLLGRGGMGAVYKGVQTSLDRPVAIKILPGGIEKEDHGYAERFRNEAKVMARLLHPAIVAVFDFGQTPGGQLYFVMEYVDGTDVHQLITSQTRLPADHALAITAHVCDALTAAHALGIVHRDIKPANVLINLQGQVKVADFGLAKTEEPGDRCLTKTGYSMGTPDYVAPESLILGIAVDGRADLYALGVMLYQMLTGEVPRGAFKDPSVRVSGLDPRFDAIVEKAMQSDRTDRYQSAVELRRDLDVILTVPLVRADECGPGTAALPQQALDQVPVQRSAVKVMVRGNRTPGSGNTAPGTPGGRKEAATKPEISPPKSNAVAFWSIGIGAAALVAAGVFYMVVAKSDPKPDSASPIAAASTPANPQPVVTVPSASETPPKVEPKAPVEAPKATEPPKAAEAAPPAKSTIAEVAPTPAMPAPAPGTNGTSATKALEPAIPAVPQIPLPSPKQWIDVTEAVRIAASEGKTETVPGGWRASDSALLNLPNLNLRDVAVRVRFRGSVSAHLRASNSGGGVYLGVIWHDAETSIQFVEGTKNEKLAKAPTPTLLADQAAEMVFAANGVDLVIWIDGKTMMAAKDTRLASGMVRIRPQPGTVIEKIEYADLSPSAPDPNPASHPKPAAPEITTLVPFPADLSPELAKRLATLDAQFQTAADRDARQAFKASVAQLDTSYQGALDRLLATAMQGGHTDEALAIRGDKQRLTQDEAVPESDEESTPASLKKARDTYRAAHRKLETERDTKLVPLVGLYLKALDGLRIEVTQAGQLDDAQKVIETARLIAARQEELRNPPAPGATKIAATAAKLETTGTDAASGRRAVEWVLGLGGEVEIEEEGNFTTIRDAGNLPTKFTVRRVSINNAVKRFPDPIDLMELAPLRELRYLDVHGFRTTPEGWMVLTRLEELGTLGTAHGTALVDDSWAKGAVEYLPKNLTTLRIYGNGQVFSGRGMGKARCADLNRAEFHGSAMDDEGLVELAKFRNLKGLLLNSTKVTDAGMAHLAGMRDLEEVQLSGTEVTAQGFAALKSLRGLRRISFGKTPEAATRDMAAVAALFPGITDIVPAPGNNSGADIEAIGRAFPKIEAIWDGPNGLANPVLDNECFAALSAFPNLRSIETLAATITDEGIAALKASKTLERVNVEKAAGVTDAALAHLAEIPTLRELLIVGTAITPAAVERFQKARPEVKLTQ